MISRQSIQLIQSRIDIVEILAEFISLKRRGVNMIGLCPFHSEKTPSFTVSPSKQIYKCFGCGRSGSTVTFLMEHEKYSYPESLRWLAKKYGVELEETELGLEEKKEKEKSNSIAIVNKFALDFFHHNLLNSKEGKQIGLSYLKERGFTKETIIRFRIGYSSSEDNNQFYQEVRKQQFDDNVLFSAGLIKKRNNLIVDSYSGRIIFPIYHLNDKVLGFAARRLRKDEHLPKYINSPQNELYNKSATLYGIHLAKKHILKQGYAIIVEGYTDVMSLAQQGIENVVAGGGTALTQEQVSLIKKFTSQVVLFYDSDEAGINASLRAINLLLNWGIEVDVLSISHGQDPDTFIKTHSHSSFNTFLKEHKRNFLDFQIETLITEESDISHKSVAVNQIAETLSSFNAVEDIIKRQEYIKYASKKLTIELESLNRLVNVHLRNRIQKKKASYENRADKQPITEKQTTFPLAHYEYYSVNDENYTLTNGKQLIAILLKHGKNEWTENHTDVAHFIFNYLNTNNLIREVRKHHIVKQILEEYLTHLHKGEYLTENHFIYHPDDTIRNLCITLFEEAEKPSEGWDKIIADFDKLVNDEYVKEVKTTLCLLSLKIIKKLMIENKQWKDQDTEQLSKENQERLTLETHNVLKDWQKKVANEMGIVVTK